jgi:hypothetical protein
LLGQEPTEELLPDMLILLAGDLDKPGDLLGDRLLLVQRQLDGCPLVLEARLWRSHANVLL